MGPHGEGSAASVLALAALEWNWGEAYEVGYTAEHGWHARRRDGLGGLITADGPDDLRRAVLDDYATRPVPR
jgi:hypothetical protein